jgi:hypothetical protein
VLHIDAGHLGVRNREGRLNGVFVPVSRQALTRPTVPGPKTPPLNNYNPSMNKKKKNKKKIGASAN